MTSLISGESDKLVHLWKLILLGCKKTIEESQQGRNQENLLRSIDLDKSSLHMGKFTDGCHLKTSGQDFSIKIIGF